MRMDTIGQLCVANSLMRRLNIPSSKTMKVRVGVKTVYTKLVFRDHQPRSYMLSPQLAKALNLPGRKKLQIRYDHNDGTIHIGPIIGILTDFLPNQPEFDPKSVQAELIYLSKIGQRLRAQCYIFTPGSINWNNKTVQGFVYRRSGQEGGIWAASSYPLPDVVYDRIATRRGEAHERITKKRLMNLPHLKYFNPSFLNKWRVHALLVQNESLHPYLPETMLLNLPNLTDMSARHRTLYLKPCNGSLGNGIIKVYRNNKGLLRYTIYKHGKHSGYAHNPTDLMKATRSSRGRRPYIVQQGINLATYNQSPFDIRIIYQKNGEGEWLISKKFVRVAPRGSSIANLSKGGSAQTSQRVFSTVLKKNKRLIEAKNQELKVVCRTVAETLETTSQKIYGELGLDIGIDKEGKFWLIEVNSKPRKTTETALSKGIVLNTFRRPLQYAIYLAGFKNRK